MKRLHAVVAGRVQQVGYRNFVEDRADALGITGWVRNLYSGEVEVMAEGDEVDLSRLLADLHDGPMMAHVSEVKSEWQAGTGEFRSFEVRLTHISD